MEYNTKPVDSTDQNRRITRRKLLAGSGAAAFAGWSGTSLVKGLPEKSKAGSSHDKILPFGMKAGFCTIASQLSTDEPLSVGESLQMAGDFDFCGVEIWGQDHIGDGSTETLNDIKDTAVRNSLRIPVYGSYLRPGEEGFEDSVDRELRIAHDLGASKIRVWGGNQEYGDHTEEHLQKTIKDMKEICDKAHKKGIEVTVEKHEGAITVSAEGCRRLIHEVDRPNFGINWQPLFHLTESELVAEAEQLAPLSNNFHLQATSRQRSPGGTLNRSLLKDSYFDVEKILRVFYESYFDGWVEIEATSDNIDFRTAIRKDREYLRSILEDFQSEHTING